MPTMLTAAALALKVTKNITIDKQKRKRCGLRKMEKRDYSNGEMLVGNLSLAGWILLGTAACAQFNVFAATRVFCCFRFSGLL
jgi:hypothetical protein